MKVDTLTKDFISDTEVFADLFNFYIYGGESVIQPEQLTERDPNEIAVPYGVDGAAVPIQRFRDAQKLYAAMTDGSVEYILCGAETQDEVHYAMPVKDNLYDALDYAGQVEEAARSHRRAMKAEKNGGNQIQKKPNSGEFLSGFWKEDKLIPSVTLTIYFGAEEWDGPLSLFEMLGVKDEKVLACMDDYHVRLVAPALMEDADIMKFRTSLREVMLFIKYSKSKEKLTEVLAGNEARFRELERRAADVINAVTNIGVEFKEGDNKVDMCQAIQDIRIEERRIGEQSGELKKARETAKNFYDMGIDIEKISEGIGYAVETVRQWLDIEN